MRLELTAINVNLKFCEFPEHVEHVVHAHHEAAVEFCHTRHWLGIGPPEV